MSRSYAPVFAAVLMSAVWLTAEIHTNPKLTAYPLGLNDSITWHHRRCIGDPVCKASDTIVAVGKYQTNGEYHLNADGKDFYWGWDRGAFGYLRTKGDFALTVRLKSLSVIDAGTWLYGSPDAVFGKWGIMVRENLVCTSRMAALMWDEYWNTCRNGVQTGCTKGQYGASWFYRSRQGLLGNASEKSCSPGDGLEDNSVPGANKLADLYLRIERNQFRLSFKYKYGTGEWKTVTPVRRDGTPEPSIVLQSNEVYVGLCAATGGAHFECDAGKGCTKAHWRRKVSRAVFDQVEFSGEILEATDVQPTSNRRVPMPAITAQGRTIRFHLPHESSNAVVSVNDILGNTVFSANAGNRAQNAITLPASLAAGCYLVTVRSNGSVVARTPDAIRLIYDGR